MPLKTAVELAKKYDMPALAVTDTHNMFAALDFSLAASGKGVQPIMGVTAHVAMDADGLSPARGTYRHSRGPVVALPLLAAKEEGYYTLLDIVSKSYFNSADKDTAAISFTQLLKRNSGLIMLSGGEDGPIAALLNEKRGDDASALAALCKQAFGDRFYLEAQRLHKDSEDLLNKTVDISEQHHIPLAATNTVFFPDEGFHEAHDALLCIADGAYVADAERRRVSQEQYFKSPREMKALFADLPEAIENTAYIAERCAYMSQKRDPILPGYACEGGNSEEDELRKQAREGLDERMAKFVYTEEMTEDEREAKHKEYHDRLNYELDIIAGMKFPGYFLIVSDFMKYGKAQDIPIGPGRGSGAGSMVAWAMQITDLDPIRFGLLFERFLNPERVSMPDFDIDFCQERRDEVIRYVQQKYGSAQVAQIITFGKLQARAVIRDVGRVLQLPYSMTDRICKMIPNNPANPVTLEEALKQDSNLRDMRRDDEDIDKLMAMALKLEGLFRHSSTHAAGVIIGDRPLDELAPMYKDPRSDMQVCGFSMKYAESCGLVKFDFLGLKTLTVIAKALAFIGLKQTPPEMAAIDLDDRPTYKLLSEGDSVGVFQLESAGMRDVLRKLGPDNIDDIIALISLYRPGPMDNIPSYIARKHGKEQPDYLDPMLEEILKETHGVIIYQEQVMEVAKVMGGYTLGGADLLRRAMGKKIASEMDAQRKLFVAGAVKKGVAEKKASSIFDILAKFAGYGFNKSHAAAYALISYQTAYLKANFMPEFLAASINLDIDVTDKISLFVQEAKLHDIAVLPPDINASQVYFTPEEHEGKTAIRYGLAGLKNVGAGAVSKIIAERNANGSFKDIFDYAERVPAECMNKRMVENMIRSGAFDKLHENRAAIFAVIERLSCYAADVREEKGSAQASLFGGGDNGHSVPRFAIDGARVWNFAETAGAEYDAIGFYLNNHPLQEYADVLKAKKVYFSEHFPELKDKQKAPLAGVVTSKKIRSSPRGRYASLNLSDPTGIYECAVFNEELLDRTRDILEPGTMLLVTAHVRKDEGGLRFTADDISEINEDITYVPVKKHVTPDSLETLEKLGAALEAAPKGKDTLTADVTLQGNTVRLFLGSRFRLSAAELPEGVCLADV